MVVRFVSVLLVVIIAGCVGSSAPEESREDYNESAAGEESFIDDHPAYNEPDWKEQASEMVYWEFDRETSEWKPAGTPPDCPEIIMKTPVDIDLATSVLYPGQERTGGYKPHGGFRFDGSDNNIEVRAPFDGYVFRGSRSLVGDEIQYSLDVVHPCGIMYRFGHMLELAPKWERVANEFREPTEGDTRTTNVEPVEVKTGELMATKVGLTNNVFVDWGVYDVRKKNEASQDSEWAALRGGEHASYALCWFELLPPEDEQKIRALPPADGTSGTQSDYC